MEQSDIDKFFSKVNKTDTCWLWTGSINFEGYGKFTYKKALLSHRVSWILAGNTLIPGLVICHSCRNRHCVNPAHLRQDTTQANTADRFVDGTNSPGSKNGNSKLTNEKVLAIRASNKSQRQIAKEYNVSQRTISLIKRRDTWSHI